MSSYEQEVLRAFEQNPRPPERTLTWAAASGSAASAATGTLSVAAVPLHSVTAKVFKDRLIVTVAFEEGEGWRRLCDSLGTDDRQGSTRAVMALVRDVGVEVPSIPSLRARARQFGGAGTEAIAVWIFSFHAGDVPDQVAVRVSGLDQGETSVLLTS